MPGHRKSHRSKPRSSRSRRSKSPKKTRSRRGKSKYNMFVSKFFKSHKAHGVAGARKTMKAAAAAWRKSRH